MERIKAIGRGSRQVVRNDQYGFPVGKAGRCKRVHGFQAGDLVRLDLPKGKYAGKWHGRLAAVGSAGNGKGCLKVPKGVAPNGQLWASMKHFKLKQRADGYGYAH